MRFSAHSLQGAVAISVDLRCKYTLTAPASVDGRGEVATLNDPTDTTNFVGYLVDSSGFESPEIRESFESVVGGDGGVHGSFFYGRRPFTMEIEVARAATEAASHARLDKLLRATNAMRADGTITWTETGSALQKLLRFRRQQPVRGPSVERRCLFGGVAADPRIVSPPTETDTTLNATVTNLGNAGYFPRFTLAATIANPVLTNTTTGAVFSLTLSGGGTVAIDFANHTVTQGGVNRYSTVNFSTSTWWELAPGANVITVTGAGTSHIFWRSAWL